jgi:phosphate transport system permease protein
MPAQSRDAGLQRRRNLTNLVATALSFCATGIVLVALASILWTLVSYGIGGLSLHTLITVTGPAGGNGGLLNPIVGSLIQVGLATLIGTPIGLMAGIYLAEFGGNSALANGVRFVSDMLLSAPSILVGLFVYLILSPASPPWRSW